MFFFYLCMLSSVFLVFSEYKDSAFYRALFKTCASLSFLALAFVLRTKNPVSPFWEASESYILLGLCCSLFGDIFLLSLKELYFKCGVAAFALAHLFYTYAFFLRGTDSKAVVLSGALCAFIGVFIARWILPYAKGMQAQVIPYLMMISLMVAFAFGQYFHTKNAYLLLGAICFYFSDLSVAIDRFVKPSWVHRAWGLPLYFLAQCLLALGAYTSH